MPSYLTEDGKLRHRLSPPRPFTVTSFTGPAASYPAHRASSPRCCSNRAATLLSGDSAPADTGPHWYCARCQRAFSLAMLEQIPNWAWQPGPDGEFHRAAPYRQPRKRGSGLATWRNPAGALTPDFSAVPQMSIEQLNTYRSTPPRIKKKLQSPA